MKSVHEPTRECICCGVKFPKKKLLRIVKNESGISLDETGKQNGRGAYICKKAACAQTLVKQKRLNRAFRGPVQDEIYEEIVSALREKCTD